MQVKSIASINLLLLVGSISAHADSIRFFKDDNVDFYRKEASKTESPKDSLKWAKPNPSSTSAPEKRVENQDSKFEWNKYLDPNSPDFFREGDYVPPAPFMEVARDPSDENIKNWFNYQKAKSEVITRLQSRLSEYEKTQGNNLPSQQVARPIVIPQTTLDAQANQFRLRLYFDSHCPHCKHMFETIKALNRRGFWIEFKQVDGDLAIRSQIPFPVTSATDQELKQYGIEGVPVLLIGNLGSGTFSKLQGYQSEEAVLEALKQLSQTKGAK